jgi:multidrug efflux pump subunit AcrA (membrane-fusion protein)
MLKSQLIVWVVAAALMGCKRGAAEEQAHAEAGHGAAPAPAPSNRIDIPPAVRQNLGITFAKAEQRRVASTIRVPGQFELMPSARREYRVGLAGRVEVLVKHLERVEPGTVLYRLDSPAWQRMRLDLAEAESATERMRAAVELAEKSKAEAEQLVAALQKRVNALAEMDMKRAEVDVELATRRAAIPRLDAEVKAKQVELAHARRHLPIQLAAAAAALGTTVEKLGEETEHPPGGGHQANWHSIDRIEVRAAAAGVVESLAVTNGAWVEAGGLVATVIDPAQVRFAATGLQSDLGRLRDGISASVVAPAHSGSEGKTATPIAGKLAVGLAHNANQRTVELFVNLEGSRDQAGWARPGVSAFAEITTEGGDDPELAIPLASVVRDELKQIFFRRDPKNPDKVIRVDADLGVDDGRWVVVNSGLAAGDEVVLDGVYELKLAGGGGKGTTGGHFHADGTWHADGTPEPGGKK